MQLRPGPAWLHQRWCWPWAGGPGAAAPARPQRVTAAGRRRRWGPSARPHTGGLDVIAEHWGMKGSLLETGGHSQPWISAGGWEHPTHAPLVLSSLRKNSQFLHAQKSWRFSVSPESFDQLPGDTPAPRAVTPFRQLLSCPVLSPFPGSQRDVRGRRQRLAEGPWLPAINRKREMDFSANWAFHKQSEGPTRDGGSSAEPGLGFTAVYHIFLLSFPLWLSSSRFLFSCMQIWDELSAVGWAAAIPSWDAPAGAGSEQTSSHGSCALLSQGAKCQNSLKSFPNLNPGPVRLPLLWSTPEPTGTQASNFLCNQDLRKYRLTPRAERTGWGGDAGLSTCFSLAAACSAPAPLPIPPWRAWQLHYFPVISARLKKHEMRGLAVQHPSIHPSIPPGWTEQLHTLAPSVTYARVPGH